MHIKLIFFSLLLFLQVAAEPFLPPEEILLKDNLKKAKTGDYIVTLQNKNFTLLHIAEKRDSSLIMEEITVPTQRMKGQRVSWKEWVKNMAPGNTSWLMYMIDLPTGQMLKMYSHTKNCWYDIAQANNFLTKLLNLRLTRVSEKSRKKVGLAPLISSNDQRPLWQPPLVAEGKQVHGAIFDAYHTRWPNDGGELSGKMIDVYIPRDSNLYPSYFPYWLQISGLVGSAKLRIIDSGSEMKSPLKILN